MKWARWSTLTESIWIRCSRRSTRRRWRMSVAPPGLRSVKPWAASAMRRAWATESDSSAIAEHVRAGVRQNRGMLVIRPISEADFDAVAAVNVRAWQTGYAGIVPQDFLDSLDPAVFVQRRRTQVARPGVQTLVADQDGRIVGHT